MAPWVRLVALLAIFTFSIASVVSADLPAEGWGWLRQNGADLKAWPPIFTVLLGIFEWCREAVERRAKRFTTDAQDQADVVLLEVESACFREGVPVKLSECGLKVWQVREVWWRIRKPPARLRKVFTARGHRPVGSSGVDWHVGKGVIGMAAVGRRPLAVDLHDEWKHLIHAGAAVWEASENDAVRYGLSYEEFSSLCPIPGTDEVAGNYLVAVPIMEGSTVRGVVALDAPYAAGGALRSSDVEKLMTALGRTVLIKDHDK